MSSMQISEWISVGSSVGTLVAALVALVSLFELKRQRKSSYKPDIAVLSSHFVIEHNNTSRNLPCFWSDPTQEGSGFRTLRIVNVGLGVAKDLKVSWNLDVNKLFGQVAKSYPKDIPTEKKLVLDGEEVFIKLDNLSILLPLTLSPENEPAYLVPSSVSTEGHLINIPSSYEALISVWVSNMETQRTDWDFSDIEPLELRLSFSDLGTKIHTQKVTLRPRLNNCVRYTESDGFTDFRLEFSFGTYT